MKSTVAWIATSGFALLAMTVRGIFSSLLEQIDQLIDGKFRRSH
jgi:hypothetical protein